uniref:Polycystin cation channel PKD1/PKD2 domain-containing protein n=1 Tax=Tetraselmis sp. GSL018 TaxID=582737 RepID=A0A061QH17_9CHLO
MTRESTRSARTWPPSAARRNCSPRAELALMLALLRLLLVWRFEAGFGTVVNTLVLAMPDLVHLMLITGAVVVLLSALSHLAAGPDYLELSTPALALRFAFFYLLTGDLGSLHSAVVSPGLVRNPVASAVTRVAYTAFPVVLQFVLLSFILAILGLAYYEARNRLQAGPVVLLRPKKRLLRIVQALGSAARRRAAGGAAASGAEEKADAATEPQAMAYRVLRLDNLIIGRNTLTGVVNDARLRNGRKDQEPLEAGAAREIWRRFSEAEVVFRAPLVAERRRSQEDLLLERLLGELFAELSHAAHETEALAGKLKRMASAVATCSARQARDGSLAAQPPIPGALPPLDGKEPSHGGGPSEAGTGRPSAARGHRTVHFSTSLGGSRKGGPPLARGRGSEAPRRIGGSGDGSGSAGRVGDGRRAEAGETSPGELLPEPEEDGGVGQLRGRPVTSRDLDQPLGYMGRLQARPTSTRVPPFRSVQLEYMPGAPRRPQTASLNHPGQPAPGPPAPGRMPSADNPHRSAW